MIVLVSIFSPVALWNAPDAHVARLRERFDGVRFVHARDRAATLAAAPDSDVMFTGELDAETFAAARRLRWLHSPAAGVGGMLFPEMVRSPVVMTNSRGIHADTMAEHVLAVWLALLRRLPLAVRRQAERRWSQDELSAPPGIRTIAGRRMGVVGLGAIGGAVARRAAALGVEVHAVRRRPDAPRPEGVRSVSPPAALLDLLRTSDVVVLAAPQTAETRSLIGRAQLAAMKPDAILINVARGRLVDEAALAEALAEGRLGGAALDVTAHEPLDPASPLWDLPGVLITPHVAGMRPDLWDAVTELFAENLRRFRAGEPLLNVVDKLAGY
jgi:phosphoglycerate dehydrogenase-like enzyme